MYQTGIVQSIDGKNIYVKIQRESACGGNCASCSSSCAKEAVVKAQSSCKVKIGDRVELEMTSSRVLTAAAAVYIVPLVIMIIGYFVGSSIYKTETAGIICGFATMVFSYILLIIYSKKKKINIY